MVFDMAYSNDIVLSAIESDIEQYAVFPENRMAILIDEYGFDELKEELERYPEIETVYGEKSSQ